MRNIFAMNDVGDNQLESARVMLGYETGDRVSGQGEHPKYLVEHSAST